MKISIVTPSFNQGRYLEATIQSVLSQNYADLEYLVVDGKSQDNSVDIIRKNAEGIAYWTSEPDRGQSDAINKGMLRTTGDVLAWLNSDDLYLPGTLQRVASYFTCNPDVDCVYGDILVIGPDGKPLYVRRTVPYDFQMALHSECLVPQPAAFWRRSVMDRVGLLDVRLRYWMDYEYFLRMGAQGVRFDNIREPLAAFRLHPNSKSVSDFRTLTESSASVKARYTNVGAGNERLQRLSMRTLRIAYRTKLYLLRVLLRHDDWLPFRATRARRAVSRAA